MITRKRIAMRCKYIVALTVMAMSAAAQSHVNTSLNGSNQPELTTTIHNADRIFLEKNLAMLAEGLNVDMQKALEIQAHSYPNPQFSAELNAFDPDNQKWFHVGSTGQKVFSIEQLILLGGKRKNEIALARQNTQQAEMELQDLLRNLRLQLHTSFYSVYFDKLAVAKYNSQIAILDTIIDSYEQQARRGNVAMKEVVRLKSSYLQLNNNRTELLQNIQEQQKNLQIMLQVTDDVQPDIPEIAWESLQHLPPVDSMYGLATTNRPDWKASLLANDIAKLNLRYQRSLAVPDLSVGAAYDQRGGAFNNQVNLNLGMPIPLWNRNRGNIRAAQTGIKLADVNRDIAITRINAEVREAWYNMQRSIQEYQKLNQLYNSDFREVLAGMADNFRKQNISILEFVDFFDSYNASISEINRIRKQLTQSAEAVNYVTATTIYK